MFVHREPEMYDCFVIRSLNVHNMLLAPNWYEEIIQKICINLYKSVELMGLGLSL